MKNRIFFLVILAAIPALGNAEQRVEIKWVEPENFTDVAITPLESERERNQVLQELERAFTAAAQKRIPTDSTLELQVTEVSLAGRFEPWRGDEYHDVRFVRDIYPARLDFSWRLVDLEGQLLREGTERLSSMGIIAPLHLDIRSEQFPFVKETFERWLRQTFR